MATANTPRDCSPCSASDPESTTGKDAPSLHPTTFAPGESEMNATATRRRSNKPVRSARWLKRPVADQPGSLEIVVGHETITYTVRPSPVSKGAGWELETDGRLDGFVLIRG